MSIYTLEYYSAIKNEILPSAATWIDPENIAVSEINQRKVKYCMLLFIGRI